MEINGLPLHPLVVHAAVVFVPLAAILSIVYVAVPRWRWATRVPTVVLSLVGLVSVITAWFSGRDLLESRAGLSESSVIKLHQERADVLLWVTVVFMVLVLLAAWALGGPSALKSERGAKGHHNALIEWSVGALLVVMAVSVLLMVIQTGDAGAESIWGRG